MATLALWKQTSFLRAIMSEGEAAAGWSNDLLARFEDVFKFLGISFLDPTTGPFKTFYK